MKAETLLSSVEPHFWRDAAPHEVWAADKNKRRKSWSAGSDEDDVAVVECGNAHHLRFSLVFPLEKSSVVVAKMEYVILCFIFKTLFFLVFSLLAFFSSSRNRPTSF